MTTFPPDTAHAEVAASQTAVLEISDETIVVSEIVAGAPGPAGPPGPPGSSTSLWRYTYSTVTSAPPNTAQVRADSAVLASITALYVHRQDEDGDDISLFLLSALAGDSIYLQDRNNAASWARFTLTGAPINAGTYVTYPVALAASGAAIAGSGILLGIVRAGGGGGGGGGPHAATHGDGGTDEVSLDASQIVTGTFNAARIPSSFATDAEVAAGYVPLSDPRLSDARAPTAHAATHAQAGSDPVAIDAAQITGGTIADARIPAAIARDAEVTAAIAAIPADGPAGTASLRTLGTGALQATAGNDARLSNARTPTAHAATHASAGSDPVSLDGAQIATGTIAPARLATIASLTAVPLPLDGTELLTLEEAGTRYRATTEQIGATPQTLRFGKSLAKLSWWEDFDNVGITAVTTDGQQAGASLPSINLGGTGAGSVAGNQGAIEVVSGYATNGVIAIQTGSTTTGRVTLGAPNVAFAQMVSTEQHRYFCRLRIPTLSTGTETFTVRAGFANAGASPTASLTDGIYVQAENGVANWRAYNRAGGVASASTDTGIAVATTAYVNIGIWYDGAGTSHFYMVAGNTGTMAEVCTIATNVPANGAGMIPHVAIFKSAGTTARQLNVDTLAATQTGPTRGITFRI